MVAASARALALLWCVVVLFVGCTVGAPETRFDVVRISPAFSADEQEEIAGAAAEWCTVSADLCVPVEFDAEHPNVHRRTGHNERSGRLSGPPVQLEIWIDVTASLWRTAAHELGHSWRGDGAHLDEPGHLMHEDSTAAARCIDAVSAEFVCQGAGCREWRATCD